MASLHIIYASTSGHTEYVAEEVKKMLEEASSGIQVTLERVEIAKPEDLMKGDVLILASSTWNTGGPEGQLNPHMFSYLLGRAKDVQLAGKKVAVIGLGDHRYRYTAKAAAHLEDFVRSHGGTLLGPILRIVDEPYGQEAKIIEWTNQLKKQVS